MKYKLGEKHPQHALYRVVYLRDIPRYGVRKGDIGGWIASERNLSQYGDCVVLDKAMVYDNAWIADNASVFDDAKICDNVIVSGDAKVYDNMRIYGDVLIRNGAHILANHRLLKIRRFMHRLVFTVKRKLAKICA